MRYLPLTPGDRADMLSAIGAGSVDELFRDIPRDVRPDAPLALPLHAGELEVEREFRALAERNMAAGSVPFFLGGGAYRHHVPATVDHLIQRSEFLTSYTQYQAEVSQGSLQALFEFQTQVALLTGMDVANASMYDGSTACAEAALMACRVTRRNRIVLSGGLHPHYADVTRTSLGFVGLDVKAAPFDYEGAEDLSGFVDGETAAVIVQNPHFFGHLKDYSDLARTCREQGALLVVVVTEVVSLGAVTAPGDMGADIVVGEGQSLGLPLSFGGPYLGLFATRDRFVRQMPGRLCGQTVDAEGRRGYVLTLSTREQHIRREKATSNICTNSGLCALAFTMHLSLLGEAGFQRLAALNHERAVSLAERLSRIGGVELVNDSFFNEFTLRLAKPAGDVVLRLAEDGILAGIPASRLLPGERDAERLLLTAATETVTLEDCERLAKALEKELAS